TDIAGNRAAYYNFGGTMDVAAPGRDNTSDMNGDGIPDGIISTVGDDQKGHIQFIYASSIGTSMATPHIAGVISLMKAVNSSLTPQIFDSLLASGKITEDLGPSGRDDDFGYGLINAYKAVLAAIDAKSGVLPQPSPRLAVTPGALNFGLRASLLTVTVSNAGTGSLRLVNITENSGGFAAVAGSSVDENGLGVYAITVARDQPGTYNAAVSFISTANTVSVPMIWQVSNSSVKGDAGNQFVLLVDADTEESLTQVMVKPLNGLYNFRFSDIPQGDYKIISGSDSNNDLIICDLGESCGAYLILSAPKTLTVNRSYSGVNFGVAFNTNFSSSTASASIPIRRNKTGFKRQPLRKLGITE
ncbi:MAG: S8 family serine peptidase, partial [Gammaproteobacteria bacterium]|nr:S8 family serine peptidase [Gammaproteobacteria bacterium]